MITQAEIDFLLNELKKIENTGVFQYPGPNSCKQLDLVSLDGKESFIVDANRKGTIKLSKYTYLERYKKDIILLRLDIDGPPHTNPDGIVIGENHLHIYKEGFGDSWAYPLPNIFSDTKNLVNTLKEFLEYCKVTNVFELSFQEGMPQ